MLLLQFKHWPSASSQYMCKAILRSCAGGINIQNIWVLSLIESIGQEEKHIYAAIGFGEGYSECISSS